MAGPAELTQTSRIRPSAELGLLLCQVLLGIPSSDGRWSPMIAAWAPGRVKPAHRDDYAASIANARDIHEATIMMIHTMVPYVLEEADTRDLRVWGFIYVILVFMRSLKTRPDLLKWFGWAFHAELLAPFLNMLVREDETQGGGAWERAFQLEFPTLCSPRNRKEKPGKYVIRTSDHIKRNDHAREEHQKAEGAGSTATAEEATASDAAHKRDWDTKASGAERMYTNPLPEHWLLRGHTFAREANAPWDKFPEDAPREDERKDREAEEAREAQVQRQEALLRDSPLFSAGWFRNSKYNFEERRVRRESVQDAETCEDRSSQILWLAFQLRDTFFSFRTAGFVFMMRYA
ncbi:hypothetical protein EDB80DRAFT_309401 [Ilyonectria destructans]|nr:hypothetical protein EDB80DRAFT_309401 [Ilyonectria destructans]